MAAVYPRKLCRSLVLDFKLELLKQNSPVTGLDEFSVLGSHYGTVMTKACRLIAAGSS